MDNVVKLHPKRYQFLTSASERGNVWKFSLMIVDREGEKTLVDLDLTEEEFKDLYTNCIIYQLVQKMKQEKLAESEDK